MFSFSDADNEYIILNVAKKVKKGYNYFNYERRKRESMNKKKKGKKQLAEAARGIVVRDDIEYYSPDIVPLFAFGLLY